MARPIEPTPKLSADDAATLLRDLEHVCAPSEAQRRMDWAERQSALMSERHRPGSGVNPSRR